MGGHDRDSAHVHVAPPEEPLDLMALEEPLEPKRQAID